MIFINDEPYVAMRGKKYFYYYVLASGTKFKNMSFKNDIPKVAESRFARQIQIFTQNTFLACSVLDS